MALDKLTIINNGGLSTTSDYRVGILTATKFVGPIESDSATFTGNVSIGGTLTYEDVTNVDSVGIITARDGIHVGAGVSVVGVGTFGALKVGSGVTIESSGQLTSNNNIRLSANSNNHSATARLQLGSDQNFEIYHNASRDNVINVDRGNLVFKNSGNNLPHGSQIINRSDGQFLVANQAQNKYRIKAYDGGAVELYYNNVERFETTSQGINVIGHSELDNVNVSGVSTFTSNVDINADLDVDGHTNLDNGNVAGIVTFNSGAALHMNGGQILLYDRPDGDSNNLFFGTGGKAVAYHDGTNFSIVNNTGHSFIGVGVGNKDLMLYAQASGNVLLQQNTGVRYVKGVGSNASVELFHNNQRKAYTESNGFYVTDTGRAAMARVIAPTGYDARIDLTADTHANEDNYRIEANTDQKFRVYGKPSGNYTSFIELDQVGRVTLTRDVDVARHLDVDGHTNLDNVSVAGVSTFSDVVGITSSLNVTGITSISSPYSLQPFTVIGGSHPTPNYNHRNQFVFKTSHGHTDFKFENSYGGNWYAQSVSHTRIVWEAYGERSGSVPGGDYGKVGEFCSIQPMNSTPGAFNHLLFKGNDGTSGLKNLCQMGVNSTQFYVGGNSTVHINSTGLGIAGNIWHINDWNSGYSAYDTYFGFPQNNQFHLVTADTRKLLITNNKLTLENLSSGVQIDSNVDLNGDLDVDGHTNLDNVSVAGVSTFTGELVAGSIISVQSGGSINIPDKLIHSGDTDTNLNFHNADKFRIELGGLTSAFSGLKSTSGANHARWGINVATPQAVLHIDEVYNHQGLLRVTNGNQNSGYYHQLEMSGTNNVFTLWRHFDGTSMKNTHAHGSTGHMWYIGGEEKVRIHSDGNVGINESSPATQFVVKQDGLDDNTYGFSTVYRSGNNASGHTASGIKITSKADNSNGEDHTAYIQFDNRTAAQNGAHGVAAFITLTAPDAQGSYGTGQFDFYCRNSAPFTFPNDPAVSSSYWMDSLFTIKSDGKVGINQTAPDTKLHIVHPSAAEDVVKIEAKPVTADTGAKSKLIFQITESNNQSARLAEIHSLAESGWGGGMAFNYKPRNSTPNNTTEEVFRFNHSGNAACNSRIVFDSYLQLGGYNNSNESFANLAVLFSARDMAGSTLVSGQSDTISGYARRRLSSEGNGTFFFGPYGAFPCGDYTALFRMKVSSNSSSSNIGYIDAIGNGMGLRGRNHAPNSGGVSIQISPNDFSASDKYQYFALDFSKTNSAAHIELRYLNFIGSVGVDIYLDHIMVLPRLNHGHEGTLHDY